MTALHVLLPALASVNEAPALRAWLARGDRLPDVRNARDAVVRELFRFAGDSMPAAAVRHCTHADNAETGIWLAADPAYVRSEATGARLMAWPLDDLGSDDASQLADALRPLLAGVGVSLSVDTPSTWCLRLSGEAPNAEFVCPVDALGVDMLECLPRGDAGRTWRRLFNEVQVTLHAHPVNARRVAAGKLPVNALWFWGEGSLPNPVETSLHAVASGDDVLRGLAKLAGAIRLEPSLAALQGDCGGGGALLLDLVFGVGESVAEWLPALQRCLAVSRCDTIMLTFAGGERFRVRPHHRLRFWRRG
ncbi:MAG: phosphoglycerate mutase [Rhodanobacteraceae bacterium]